MSKYFLFLNDENNNRGIEALIRSLLGNAEPIKYLDTIIYIFNDYEELMFEDAINAYMFDFNMFFKCYISKDLVQESIEDNYKNIYKYFISVKKQKIYHEAELIDESISLADSNLKKQILAEYTNDLEMHSIINAFVENDLNILKTAKVLYLHRNTLINKLDRFYQKTGYDLRRFKDAYIIYSLLKAKE